jgi:hypothetical protein
MTGAALHLNDDACADLVLGLAGVDERAMAETHLRSCPECEMRLRAHAGARVRARADLAGGVGVRVVVPPRKRNGWLPAAGVAAAVVAIVLLARSPVPSRRLEPRWLTTPGELVRVRGDEPIDDRLRAGFAAYARHDLPAAIAALEAAHATAGAEQARRLYLGHALLAAGRAAEARTWLERVDLNALPQPWRDEAVQALAAARRAVDTASPREGSRGG